MSFRVMYRRKPVGDNGKYGKHKVRISLFSFLSLRITTVVYLPWSTIMPKVNVPYVHHHVPLLPDVSMSN